MEVEMYRLMLLLAFFSLSFQTRADSVTGAVDAFTGPNVYSPSVIYDYQESNYKMWYGGWQAYGQQQDHIYYKASGDGVAWPSGYIEVLTPESVSARYQQLTGQSISIVHVNDPSVTKHFNNASGAYQYTMFFDACLSPCTVSGSGAGLQNTLWSVVSNDGINWDYPQPLNVSLPSGVAGPQNPSVIIDNSNPSNVFWHVYFSVAQDNGAAHAYLAYVNGSRNPATGAFSVLSPGLAVQNPSVMILGSTWYMMFNTPNELGGYDVYYSTSTTNSWYGASPLISADGNPNCMVDTPSGLPLNGSQYLLYFSTIAQSSGGGCDFTKNQTMTTRVLVH